MVANSSNIFLGAVNNEPKLLVIKENLFELKRERDQS